MKIEEARARLDGELVERHMPLLHAQRTGQLFTPIGERLPGARIDQIQGHLREYACGESESIERLGGGVLAAQEHQIFILQRLDAERETIDAGQAIAAEVLRFGTRR